MISQFETLMEQKLHREEAEEKERYHPHYTARTKVSRDKS